MAAPDGLPSTSQWAVELPAREAPDADFGGCRGIETNYSKDAQIGEGTYGEVYVGTCHRTREKVALKKIRMDNEKEGFPITAIREIKLLKSLDHPNVITLKEIVRSQAHVINNMKGSIYMVFDYMDHDLTGLMERRNYRMEVSHVKCYMKQLLKGLNFCHSKNVLHRDLKASNLLINNSGILKIADFGLARYKDETTQKGRLTNRVITLWYRPPELLLGATEYGPEIDIWSVGCIFAELLAGQPLFPGRNEADQLDKICRVLGSPTEQSMPGVGRLAHAHMVDARYKENRLRKHLMSKKITDPEALDLLAKLLELDPRKRVTASDANMHQYFWKEPMPAEPADLPRYAPSHELDMKKLRQEAKGRAAGGPAAAAQQPAKKPRLEQQPQPQSLPAPRQPHLDARAQQRPGYREPQPWEGRGGGGYGEAAPAGVSHAGMSHGGGGGMEQPRFPEVVPGMGAYHAGYPGQYDGGYGGGYGAPGPYDGGGGYPPFRGHPPPAQQPYRAPSGGPPQETGAPPPWTKQRR